jgi:HlyD family secretion protein
MQQVTTPSAPLAATPVPAGQDRRRRRWLIGAAMLLLLLAVAGGTWWLTYSDATIRYTTAPVTRGAVTRAVRATGTVNPVLTIIVGSYVSGVIQELLCDYNTQVKKGQICAKIDPRPYQSVVDQSNANLDIAKAQLEKDKASLGYAQINYERNRLLAQRNYASQDVADNARNVYEQAQAQIALDEATIELRQALLDAAKINLGYTDIASPVDGTVVSRNVTMGQTVAASFQTPTLFLIATDLTKLEVDTNVSESDIGAIKQRNNANFTVDAFPGRVFTGSVVQVRQSPQTVQNVVTYDVVVGVDNADLALRPGMTASTQIIIDQRSDVIRVPDQALRYAPGGVTAASPPLGPPPGPPPGGPSGGPGQTRLWLLRDGHAVVVPVVLGLDDDSFTELVSGDVKPGDQAIIAEQRGATAGSALPLPRL